MKYAVTIEATVRKTIEIEADTEQQAIEDAHSAFTVTPEEGEDEKYDEQMISCVQIAD